MGMRVLVADDEALIALSHADLLEAEGYEVALASDGAAALDAARRLGAELGALVTDLDMPGMGGEDLIHAVRADRPDLPVLAVPARPRRGARRRCGAARAATDPCCCCTSPQIARGSPRRWRATAVVAETVRRARGRARLGGDRPLATGRRHRPAGGARQGGLCGGAPGRSPGPPPGHRSARIPALMTAITLR